MPYRPTGPSLNQALQGDAVALFTFGEIATIGGGPSPGPGAYSMVSRAQLSTIFSVDSGAGLQQVKAAIPRWAPTSTLLDATREQIACAGLTETTIDVPSGAVIVILDVFQQTGLQLLFGTGETAMDIGANGIPLILPVTGLGSFLIYNTTSGSLQVEVVFC